MNRPEATDLSRHWLLWLLTPLGLALWFAPAAAGAVGFAPKVTYPATDMPSRVVVGDFNDDADPDLVVGPLNGTSVSVRLGGPGGEFGPVTEFSIGNNSVASIAVGDFNADGDPDLAVTTYGSSVFVLLGQAGGSFGAPTAVPAGPSTTDIAVGDFNGDGDPDLVVTNEPFQNPHTLTVLLGGPGSTFGPATAFSTESHPGPIAVGDFNGDGDPDLAFSNYLSSTISVRLGEAGGSFGAPTMFPVNANTLWIADGDFNGDGDPDLAVTDRSSKIVSVLLGGAGGSFGRPQNSYPAGDSPEQVAVSDFNRDGDPDLAVANYFSDDVSVLDGGPGGSFKPQISFPTAAYAFAIAAGDFNADGNPDLVVTNQDANRLSVLLNNGVDLDPGTIEFPSTAAGDESAIRTVMLTNLRDRDLQVGNVQLAGVDQSGFAKGTDTCTGATVAPGATCSVAVRFRPGRLGAHSAKLAFTHDAPASPQSVPLSGTGTPPVTLSPSSIAWQPRPDSTTSGSRTVTLENRSGGAVAISGVALGGPDVTSFRLPPRYDECAGTTVPGGGACEVRVSFRPDGVGPKTARLEFTDDAVTSPQTVALSGTGTPGPWLTRSVQALKFGHVRVGTTSATKSVTLTNTGSAAMEINAITLEGANPGNFVGLTETCTALESLGPDKSCSAEVAFRPTATGPRTATLKITDTAPRSPHRVALTGSGS